MLRELTVLADGEKLPVGRAALSGRESVGLPRKAGWTDAKYREYLRMKILRWNWDGTNGTVSALLEAAVPGATESDNGNGTVTISVPGSLPAPASELFPVPAGIRTIIL